jgi:hypothetical protein
VRNIHLSWPDIFHDCIRNSYYCRREGMELEAPGTFPGFGDENTLKLTWLYRFCAI